MSVLLFHHSSFDWGRVSLVCGMCGGPVQPLRCWLRRSHPWFRPVPFVGGGRPGRGDPAWGALAVELLAQPIGSGQGDPAKGALAVELLTRWFRPVPFRGAP